MDQEYPHQPLITSDKNSKNPYQRYTSIIASIALLAVVISLVSLTFKRNQNTQPATAAPNQNYMDNYNANHDTSQETGKTADNEEETTTQQDFYRIGVFDEKISVFKNTEPTPFLVTNVFVHSLPKEDLRLLQEGIQFDDYNKVRSFLEDYH